MIRKGILLRIARLACIALAAIATVLFATPMATAHGSNETYLYIDVGENDLGGTVEMRLVDLIALFDLDADADGSLSMDEVAAGRTLVEADFLDKLSFDIADTTPALTFTDITYLDSATGTFAQFHFVSDYRGPFPDVINATYQSTFDQVLEGHRAMAVLRSNQRIGLRNNEGSVAHIFASGTDTARISLLGDPPMATFTKFLKHGMSHSLSGFDHLALVLVLLLPSVLVASAGHWHPAPGLLGSAWSIVRVAVVFALANAATLTLSALLGIATQTAIIEIIIALSIVALAGLNIITARPGLTLPIVAGLGLLHGFGYSYVMEPFGVAHDVLAPALLGFNIGVAIGLLVIIAIAFPVLFILREQRWYVPLVLRGGSALLILAAVYWFGGGALGVLQSLAGGA